MSKLEKYIKVKKGTKKRVSEARTWVFDRLYRSLKIKEGEKTTYRFAKGRERKQRKLD